MLVVIIAKFLGWLCAHLPEAFARSLCALTGDVIYFLPTGRRYLGLSNLHHAFPERSAAWRRKITREASRRLIEMVMYDLSAPYFSEARLKSIIAIPEQTKCKIEHLREAYDGMGGVMLVPHFTLFEALTAVPCLYKDMPEFGAIFRPFDNKHLNQFIKETRARFGVTLFSRKEGFGKALELIRRGGWVGVLYDQNAGMSGALITLFGRTAAATDLPGMMCKKFDAPCIVAWMERTGFWRCTLRVEELHTERTPQAVTLASNVWLERYLKTSDDACADWLWTHKRWKCQDNPPLRLRLHQKKIWLGESAAASGYLAIPRRTRFWVRLPNWLGDVVMAIPLLRAIRSSRPDAEITVLAQKHFIELLELLNVADRHIALPDKKQADYYRHFKQYREEYPDTYLLFTNSLRGDREAKLTGCPQRFGMLRPGKKRPLLTHCWNLPDNLDERSIHQTLVWEKWLQHFGLNVLPDRTPLAIQTQTHAQKGAAQEAQPVASETTLPANTVPNVASTSQATTVASTSQAITVASIGLICGTENDPSKRWPVDHWRELIRLTLETCPDLDIKLFGTSRDAEITAAVQQGFPLERVADLAGKTTLPDFARALQDCACIICNDTGGMHLANMLGVPVIATYGPTNPVRTGPFFDAPVTILQPDGCPPTGGASLTQLPANRVFNALQQTLHNCDKTQA